MKKKHGCYWIYILECNTSRYYTGYTDDLAKRYSQHISGRRGAKFTRGFKPSRIARCWKLCADKGTALRIEHFVKTMKREKKNVLVQSPESLKKYLIEELELDVDIEPLYEEEIKRVEFDARDTL